MKREDGQTYMISPLRVNFIQFMKSEIFVKELYNC